jgi:hypothetical protein
MGQEIRDQDDEIARLRAALEKYADYGNWRNIAVGVYDFDIVRATGKNDDADDPWKIARDALDG